MKKENVIISLGRLLLTIVLVICFSISGSEHYLEASPMALDGMASWYAEFSPGIRPTTANMEQFNHNKMTCAMWGLPFGTMVEVTNLDNDQKIVVRINDRGPALKYVREGRIIDLTKAAFEKIADLKSGLANVRVRVIGACRVGADVTEWQKKLTGTGK